MELDSLPPDFTNGCQISRNGIKKATSTLLGKRLKYVNIADLTSASKNDVRFCAFVNMMENQTIVFINSMYLLSFYLIC